MMKKYYIFLAIACVLSFGAGFLLSWQLLCKVSDPELSLEEISDEEEDEEIEEIERECDLYVDVSGAVLEPRVACLDEGSTVSDAIKQAQGFNYPAFASRYVAQRINLARILKDQDKIYIPFRSDVVCEPIEDEEIEYIAQVMEEVSEEEGVVSVPKKEAEEDDKEVEKEDKDDSDDEKEEQEDGEEEEEKEKVVDESEVLDGGDDCININTASVDEITELSGIGESRANDIIDARPYSSIEELNDVSGIGDATFNNIKDFVCV